MTGYRLSIGARKALWALLYLALAAAVDAILRGVADIPSLREWIAYPVIIALLTMLGNWLKYRRAP